MIATTTRGRNRPLGHRQRSILHEAASEVSRACPWVPIDGDRRTVESLVRRGLLGATDDLFGITAEGCVVVSREDHELGMSAIRGLKRNRDQGEVLPWQI